MTLRGRTTPNGGITEADMQDQLLVPYLPYLVDHADGCKGHFAIGRWNPGGYREVWNLRTHQWGSFSDDVLTLEEVTKMLQTISFHPMTPSLRGA